MRGFFNIVLYLVFVRKDRRVLYLRFMFLILAIGLLHFETRAIPAFPTAEGYGVSTTHGRGGKIIKVTNLLPFGPGSFQAACEEEGSRIIVFDVSGIIELKSAVTVKPFAYIAGQTSPCGITIYNWPYGEYPRVETANGGFGLMHDVVVRHLRIRGTPYHGECIMVAYQDPANCVIDHVSVSWSGDEIMDFWGSSDFTLQWSTLEESCAWWHGEGDHNYGPILVGARYGARATCHHNLFAHHLKRCPEAGGAGMADIRNCVMYNITWVPVNNFGDTGNIVGNYVRKGYNNREGGAFVVWPLPGSKIYLSDNFCEGNPQAAKQEELVLNPENGIRVSTPFDVPFVETQPYNEAYELVLKQAGAWPRDSTTRRTIMEVMFKEGKHVRALEPQWDDPNNWRPIPDDNNFIPETHRSSDYDKDNDGMADSWELLHGLNPNIDDHNGLDLSKDGYTNIEVFINQLSDSLVGLASSATRLYFRTLPIAKSYCYPNPFSGEIAFSLLGHRSQLSGDRCRIGLRIYDINGRVVFSSPFTFHLSPKEYTTTQFMWDGLDNRGMMIGEGNYYYLIIGSNELLGSGIIIKVK